MNSFSTWLLLKYLHVFTISLLFAWLVTGCSGGDASKKITAKDLSHLNWSQIVERARGQSITMMMWKGDQNINDYMQNYVRPRLKKRYGINLRIAGGQGNTIVSILMKELEAGKASSEIDMMWINGETFYQLRRIDALFGPFLNKLPNSRYLDMDNPFIKYDFQQPINGYEVPWGNVQFTMIYDTAKIEHPPRNMAELKTFVRRHPGRFTIPNDFTGMTFLKSLMIAMAGADTLQGDIQPDLYQKYSKRLWEYIRELKPHLWRDGQTFPSGVSELHRLYANGQVWITMSNNEAEADNKVAEGLFPAGSRAYVLDSGTIRNSHYIGIPRYSSHKAAAMVAANFLISPGAQLQKLKPSVWGDGTVLDRSKLPDSLARKFRRASRLQHAPPRDRMHQKALQELAPKYMIRLYEDFRNKIIQ